MVCGTVAQRRSLSYALHFACGFVVTDAYGPLTGIVTVCILILIQYALFLLWPAMFSCIRSPDGEHADESVDGDRRRE